MSKDKLVENETKGEVSRREHRPTVVPSVDVAESETEITLWADMPGIDQENVNIDLERNRLTVTADCPFVDSSGHRAGHREYRVPRYERSFVLGDTIDRDAIVASVQNGVLKLVLPKTAAAKPRRIEILAG